MANHIEVGKPPRSWQTSTKLANLHEAGKPPRCWQTSMMLANLYEVGKPPRSWQTSTMLANLHEVGKLPRSFSDNEGQETDKSKNDEALVTLDIKQVPQEEKQSVSYYVEPYELPILFPRCLEHHTEEALVHKPMESLKKIRINCPLLKEIRQIDDYAKHIKNLVANKPKTEEDDKVKMNPRLEDLEESEEDKANVILRIVLDKLDEAWFNGTSKDEDDLEGIIVYLEPKSYDGIIDLDNESYNERKCRLLGLTYREPPPILIEKVSVTRYNVAAIRAGLMKKIDEEGSAQRKT
ncbi:hypothetical protein Tco_0806618 [Tanacetum coccineum]